MAGTRSEHREASASGPVPRSQRRAVTVRIAGKDYGIISAADEAWLQNVAMRVDEAMSIVRERTETVDSLDVAVLTALNLARELMLLREQMAALGVGQAEAAVARVDTKKLQDLIAFAEGALNSHPAPVLESRT